MATTKGFCYALSRPLITLNTLHVMAASARQVPGNLLCPMIDARRMEVFTALFDHSLNQVVPSGNMILNEYSFAEWLEKNPINFFGNGSVKAAAIIQHRNAMFTTINTSAVNMTLLSFEKFEHRQFDDLAYSEPYYGKDFHSPIPKKNY